VKCNTRKEFSSVFARQNAAINPTWLETVRGLIFYKAFHVIPYGNRKKGKLCLKKWKKIFAAQEGNVYDVGFEGKSARFVHRRNFTFM
jgi:hypothetical protein